SPDATLVQADAPAAPGYRFDPARPDQAIRRNLAEKLATVPLYTAATPAQQEALVTDVAVLHAEGLPLSECLASLAAWEGDVADYLAESGWTLRDGVYHLPGHEEEQGEEQEPAADPDVAEAAAKLEQQQEQAAEREAAGRQEVSDAVRAMCKC